MFNPVSHLILHPRQCDVCHSSAENPYVAVWNSDLNERVSMCSHSCFTYYVKHKIEYVKHKLKQLCKEVEDR